MMELLNAGSPIELIGTLLAGSVGVWAITEGIKRAPSIKSISPGNYAKVRAVAVIASAAVALFMRWTDNSLDVASVQSFGQTLLDGVSLFMGSQAVYSVAKIKEGSDISKGE